jgi:hypothetical protein
MNGQAGRFAIGMLDAAPVPVPVFNVRCGKAAV